MERHISIICFVLFYTVFVTALGHSIYSKYASRKKGNTEFPCTLPCSWRGKTFDVYNLYGVGVFPNWTIDASGKSGAIPIGLVFECYQITNRFIIFRIRGTDTFFCSTVFYDGSTDPVTFALNDVDPDAALLTFENKTDEFKDICEVCKFPGSAKLLFVESGAPRPNDPSVECNLPSHCECCGSCTSCVVCETDGNIPKACKKKSYRYFFKRKGFDKKTYWARKYRKSLKKKGIRAKSWLYGKRYT